MARVRRAARTLQLELGATTIAGHHFAEGDRTAIAELAGPTSKLMAAVTSRVRLHAGEQLVSREDFGELGALDVTGGQSEVEGDLLRIGDQTGTDHRRRVHRRPARVEYRPRVK